MSNIPTQENKPNLGRTFNQFTRSHYDTCEYETQLRVGSKPMKYYVNQLNSPQVNPFTDFTVIGNKKQFDVRNDYERPLPSRLNALPQSYVLPYATTPFLANAHSAREYSNTESNLRFGSDLREKKSALALGEVDYNRWDSGVNEVTVQNAGQFNMKNTTNDSPKIFNIDKNGMMPGAKIQNSLATVPNDLVERENVFDYKEQNNVIFANSAWPYFGISSRDLLHNASQLNNC